MTSVTLKCAGCGSRDVGHEDYCFGCDHTICSRCIKPLGHNGRDDAHALTKSQYKAWETGMAKRKLSEAKAAPNVEDLIRLAVRTQARLRREGIALHWTLNYAPCEPERPASAKKTAT